MSRITTHPGEVLREEFMAPLGLSATRLGEDLHVPPHRILAIMNGRRAVTPDTAIRLAAYFGTTDRFWMNLQVAHDLSKIAITHGDEIRREVRQRVAV